MQSPPSIALEGNEVSNHSLLYPYSYKNTNNNTVLASSWLRSTKEVFTSNSKRFA